MDSHTFSPAERAIFRRLTTPEKIQCFLDDLVYNKEIDGETCRSPRRVLRDRTAHCMEGALFGAAALGMLGHPPLLLDLEAVRDDDHVLAIFQRQGHWGAITKSNYSGLRYREPVYRTLRELSMSYFHEFFDTHGRKTLRAYSRTLDLRRVDPALWVTNAGSCWAVHDMIAALRHYPLVSHAQARALSRRDAHERTAARLVQYPRRA